MAIDLLADEPEGIDLLAEEPVAKVGKTPSYQDLSKQDQAKALDLARQQISAQYPNLPDWMREMMLRIAPKDNSPRLEKMANMAHAATNFIPVTSGAVLQGASIPVRGVASMIPAKLAQDFANVEDLRGLFPEPRNGIEKLLQGGGEIYGSLGGLGKIFGALKGTAQAARVPKVLQNATALAGTGIIGTPGGPEEKVFGGAGALALGGAGKVAGKVVQKVPPFMRGLLSDSTYDSLVKSVQKPYDTLNKSATELYDFVKDTIKKRNIPIPVKAQYLDEAKEILPRTRATQKLIDNAKSGDYDAVHDLQSHLYKKGTKAMASDDVAMENQGEEIIDLRNKINEEVRNHLIQNGHADIAHVLEQGRGTYKQMMETYFGRNLPKGIGKLVHPELRLVPENPVGLFEENSVPMKKFLEQHPETGKHLKGVKEKKAAIDAIGNILGKTAIVGGTAYAGKSLFDFMK